MTLTLNLHACRQPIWAQVRQVKPTLKCNTNNCGVSPTTTKHAEIIHQSTPQIRIMSQYLPIAQMTITSVRNKLARPTSPGATRATTSQRVPSKYPDPTFRWEICSIPPQFPIMFHTTAGPRFNVEKVCEPLDPVIPRMKDDMPIAGPINARRRAHHRSKQLSKSYVHLVQISLVKRAVSSSEQSNWRNCCIEKSQSVLQTRRVVAENLFVREKCS